jgi:hypothetical protein
VFYTRHKIWKGVLECDVQLEHSTLALFNKIKKGLLEKCCNLGTFINIIALFEAAPKDEIKYTKQLDVSILTLHYSYNYHKVTSN